jgi:cytochrome subunit of sulfide dehydrogenase
MKFQLKIWFFAGVFTTASLFTTLAAQAAKVVVSPATQSNNQHIRTLAASCAACHGSNGNAVAVAGSAVLAGIDASYFSKQMLAFKDSSRPATVMHHHAKGLNLDEIDQLALYFSQQKRVANTAPKTQTLKANHDN